MKRVILLLIGFILLSFYIFSQTRKVTSCWNYLRYGQIKEAKQVIDEAIKHPKTKDLSKTWLYYGRTYKRINDSCMYSKNKEVKAEYCALEPNALNISYNAFMRAWLLNFKDLGLKKLNLKDTNDQVKFLKTMMDTETKYESDERQLQIMGYAASLTNSFVNKGLEFYRETEYDSALNKFETAAFLSNLKIMFDRMQGKELVLDTQIYYYAAIAARKARDYRKAKQYYDLLIKFNFGETEKERARLYLTLAEIYRESGDTAGYLKTIKKGMEKYKGAAIGLMNNLINYYLSINKSEEALIYLDSAINREPGNANYYVVKGSIYESLKEIDKAEQAYKRAIVLDSNYVDALFNLSVLYYNQAADFNKMAMDTRDNNKYQELIDKRNNKFKDALPLLERAHKLSPEDLNIMRPLKTVYYQLKMLDEYNAIKEKIDKLQR